MAETENKYQQTDFQDKDISDQLQSRAISDGLQSMLQTDKQTDPGLQSRKYFFYGLISCGLPKEEFECRGRSRSSFILRIYSTQNPRKDLKLDKQQM